MQNVTNLFTNAYYSLVELRTTRKCTGENKGLNCFQLPTLQLHVAMAPTPMTMLQTLRYSPSVYHALPEVTVAGATSRETVVLATSAWPAQKTTLLRTTSLIQ